VSDELWERGGAWLVRRGCRPGDKPFELGACDPWPSQAHSPVRLEAVDLRQLRAAIDLALERERHPHGALTARAYLVAKLVPGDVANEVDVAAVGIFSEPHPSAFAPCAMAVLADEVGADYAQAHDRLRELARRSWPWLPVVERPAPGSAPAAAPPPARRLWHVQWTHRPRVWNYTAAAVVRAATAEEAVALLGDGATLATAHAAPVEVDDDEPFVLTEWCGDST
jgi:hypothetical protein